MKLDQFWSFEVFSITHVIPIHKPDKEEVNGNQVLPGCDKCREQASKTDVLTMKQGFHENSKTGTISSHKY